MAETLCNRAPEGWYCTRTLDHGGSCAAMPTQSNKLWFGIAPIFAWYDLWVGAYWDRKQSCLYLFPIPMLGLKISFRREFRKDAYE